MGGGVGDGMLNGGADDARVNVIAGYGGKVRTKPVGKDGEVKGGLLGFPDGIERLWLDGGVGARSSGMVRGGGRTRQADNDKGI